MFRSKVPAMLNRQFNRYLTQYARNNQIFIHPAKHLGSTIVSFSRNPEDVPIGTVIGPEHDITPQNFQDNEKFLSLLHKTIGETVWDDFLFIVEAGVNASSYMPIYDFRHTPNFARIPEVDDIFGYVQVDGNGKMIPNTYESNSMYRLINGESGLIKLSDHLHEKVGAACKQAK